MVPRMITLPYCCICILPCLKGMQVIPYACLDAMKHTLRNSVIFAWGFLLRIAKRSSSLWVVFLYAKPSTFSVPHSPPALISLYKLLYYFHITVQQGSYRKLCASFALPLLIPIACLGMHKCTHYSFIFLSRWARHQMGRPLWITCKNTLHFYSMYIFTATIIMHCILTTFWMRNRKLLLLCLYLDAGVIPCGNSTYDLWPSNMWSLTRR